MRLRAAVISISLLSLIVFESFYWCVHEVFNAGEFSSLTFSWSRRLPLLSLMHNHYSWPFDILSPLTILRKVQSNLQWEMLWYSFLWWDSYWRPWFQEVFSFFGVTLFLFIFLHFSLSDLVLLQYSRVLVIFLLSRRFNSILISLFYSCPEYTDCTSAEG